MKKSWFCLSILFFLILLFPQYASSYIANGAWRLRQGKWKINVVPPENMPVEYYTNGRKYLKVGYVGDTIYIGGLLRDHCEADWNDNGIYNMSWIYGTVKDSMITLTSDSIGNAYQEKLNTSYDYTFSYKPLHLHPYNFWYDEAMAWDYLGECTGAVGMAEFYCWSMKPGNITLEFDSISKKIWHLNSPYMVSTSVEGEDYCWRYTCEGILSGVVEDKDSVKLEYFPSIHQVPKAPVMTKSNRFGYDGCVLEADIFSMDNHLMPCQALYYKIYADGKEIVDNIVFRKEWKKMTGRIIFGFIRIRGSIRNHI